MHLLYLLPGNLAITLAVILEPEVHLVIDDIRALCYKRLECFDVGDAVLVIELACKRLADTDHALELGHGRRLGLELVSLFTELGKLGQRAGLEHLGNSLEATGADTLGDDVFRAGNRFLGGCDDL